MSPDEPLHPDVRAAILDDARDRPLTMSWEPKEPELFDSLGLPPPREKKTALARNQILAEAIAIGDYPLWISYSRRREYYSRPNLRRYFPATLTYDNVVRSIDQMAGAGLLDHQKMPPGHRGVQSRFRASELLLKQVQNVELVHKPRETIILRGTDKLPVGYTEGRETRRMRRNLQTINEALAASTITLRGKELRTFHHRVFNENFSQGGRFYGPDHQNVPSEQRSEILIDGMATIELDYPSLHPTLLYNTLGLSVPADPYDITGWSRRHVKLGLLILINANTRASAVRALAGEIGGKLSMAEQLVTAIEARHAPISAYFGSGAGVMLQRKDSDMAEEVMLTLIDDGTIPLCVHDSFLVPTEVKPKLEEAMEIALEKTRETTPKAKVSTCNDSLTTSTTYRQSIPQYGTRPLGVGGWEWAVRGEREWSWWEEDLVLPGSLREWASVSRLSA